MKLPDLAEAAAFVVISLVAIGIAAALFMGGDRILDMADVPIEEEIEVLPE